MSIASLTITFANATETDNGRSLLDIRQEEWQPYTSQVTKIIAVRWLGTSLYLQDQDDSVSCGLVDGKMVARIFAYPATPELAYTMHASYGELSDRTSEIFEVEEIVNFRMTDRARTEYPPMSIISAEAIGEAYNASGAQIDLQSVTIDGDELVLSGTAWAAVQVRYMVYRHVYTMTAEPRDDAETDLFGAVVYGIYDGGLSYLEVEPPPGADAFAGTDCGWHTLLQVPDPDDDEQPLPTADKHNRYTEIGLCSGEVLSDSYGG